MGPSAIRYAGVSDRLEKLNYVVNDLGDVPVTQLEQYKKKNTDNLNNLEQVIEINENVAKTVDQEMQKDNFPLILGGDHSMALGTIAGVAKHYQSLGVIWYDAHGDLNTNETSPSGNIHGMPLAATLGIGHDRLINIYGYTPKVKPENIVVIGARDLDDGEKELIKKENIKVYTMHEIDRMGMPKVIEETISYLKERTDGVHLSLDLDGLDPSEAPGLAHQLLAAYHTEKAFSNGDAL